MGEAEEAAAEGEATLFFAGGQETQQFANAAGSWPGDAGEGARWEQGSGSAQPVYA